MQPQAASRSSSMGRNGVSLALDLKPQGAVAPAWHESSAMSKTPRSSAPTTRSSSTTQMGKPTRRSSSPQGHVMGRGAFVDTYIQPRSLDQSTFEPLYLCPEQGLPGPPHYRPNVQQTTLSPRSAKIGTARRDIDCWFGKEGQEEGNSPGLYNTEAAWKKHVAKSHSSNIFSRAERSASTCAASQRTCSSPRKARLTKQGLDSPAGSALSGSPCKSTAGRLARRGLDTAGAPWKFWAGTYWQDYDVKTCRMLNEAEKQGKNIAQFMRDHVKYTIDLRELVQTNTRTGNARAVMKLQIDAACGTFLHADAIGAFGDASSTSSAYIDGTPASAAASASTSLASAPTTASASECRELIRQKLQEIDSQVKRISADASALESLDVSACWLSADAAVRPRHDVYVDNS